MRELILALILLLVAPVIATGTPSTDDYEKSWSNLAGGISKEFRIPEKDAEEVVSLAKKYGKTGFPTALDILAVIAVESRFNPKAKNYSSVGLMQIHSGYHKVPGLRNPETNIRVGSRLLQEYWKYNSHYTLASYNAGPAMAKLLCEKGGTKCKLEYPNKVEKAKKKLLAMMIERDLQ